MNPHITRATLGLLVALAATALRADEQSPPTTSRFQPLDVFSLEYASDPQIAPDGRRVVYVRNFFDIMADRQRSNLWLIDIESGEQRPLTTGSRKDSAPRFSPDGARVLYISSEPAASSRDSKKSASAESAQLFCRWLDTGQTARLAQFTDSPGDPVWSPDGRWIAFTMLVREKAEPFVEPPPKPEGAEWAEAPRVIRRVTYRYDGRGYLKEGFRHVFVLPAEGGTPRQLTTGAYHHEGPPAWTADGKSLIISANRDEDWEYQPRDSELYTVDVADGRIRRLTERRGPDAEPAVSSDGRRLAWVGYDDRLQGYQVTRLSVRELNGGEPRLLTAEFDRDVRHPVWSGDGGGVFFQFDDEGDTSIGFVDLEGQVTVVAEHVGGTTIGRPYASGSFSVSDTGVVTFTETDPQRPADVAVATRGGNAASGSSQPEKPGQRRLTSLNDDILAHKQLGEVEEFWYESAHDRRRMQGWIVKPPGFDPANKYPLILEIHGGPFANYGRRFAAELQLYASAGYVVLYVNPRGSTGYGEEFGNLIHHAYPGHDYDDLMSGVDVVLERDYVDPERLYVTGGSGGGVLTAWIVGKTGRFRAAVAAKPVINWYSFTLTADAYPFFSKYWFPGYPWEHAEHYLKRSPLSLVGNVSTPTMLLTGEADYRTPISESEQFYQALKLRKIDTALVRIPEASHAIVERPSRLIAKVAHILKWFEIHGGDTGGAAE
ncbi:MAG: S9 family peptidase [Planctomycetes bacterium]|nr:S9 family peptidase [Planctomycetota bacterium]